ncbi:MAG: hypothetical protein HY647_11205 [Acidobacteria bacterium]|nr:hypothetical protein [Acidobacteriota bacterium]
MKKQAKPNGMAAQITVEEKRKGDGWECRVSVREGGGQTVHTVTVRKSYRDRLVGPEVPVAELVRKSFEFLLAYEPKESILRSFDLPVIGQYFPDYEKEIRRLF